MRLQAAWLSELSLYQVGGKLKAERNRRLGALFRHFGKKEHIPTTQEIQMFLKSEELSKKEASSLRRSFVYRLNKKSKIKHLTQKNNTIVHKRVYLNSVSIKQRVNQPVSNDALTCPQLKAILFDINQRHSEEIRDKGEQTNIEEGFVYLLEHPLYPGWVKAGMTIDYIKRIELYNQADPLSRYRYIDIFWVANRREMERKLLRELAQQNIEISGEWFFLDSGIALQIMCELFSG